MRSEPTIWHNCYNSSWKGMITDASFAHPAKFARGLIERIYDHCLAKGYLKRGDLVADVFGGIGTGGITAAYRGLNWIGCELEPKFVAMAQENFRLHRHGWSAMRGGTATIIQGDSRKFDEHVAGIVSSPPYAETQTTVGNVGNAVYKEYGKASSLGKHDKYGISDGQIGSLKSGAVEAVISSPPFSAPNMQPCIDQGVRKDLVAAGKCPETNGKTHRASGNIETLKEGTVESVTGIPASRVQAIVSSPPFLDARSNTEKSKQTKYGGPCAERHHTSQAGEGYGQSTGQISQLKGGSVDACVSSPPWENNSEGKIGSHKWADPEKAAAIMSQNDNRPNRHQTSAKARKAQFDRDNAKSYGDSEGQIGKETGETYWESCLAVYSACYRCIRPAGVIVLVVKDYCAKGKRVRLCDDTMKLLEHIGFQPLERIHSMLVTETVENGLFGEERTKRQRKSFFRRLYEAKLPEQDERRIDHEEILICRRP